MKRITIYDVAKEADVSLATVSRVINGSEVVREDTRMKVQEAIEKLGYKPNAIAQGLALSKTTTIALIVPEASFFYTGQIINGLIDVAKIFKYNIMLHTTTSGITEMNDIIETIIKSRADGVVIFNDKMNKEELNTLTRYQIPIVVIGNRMSDETIGSVYVDYAKLIFDYATKCIEEGKSNIALVDDRKNPAMIKQLHEGLKRAFSEKGMEFNNYLAIPKEYRSSYTYLKDYMSDPNNRHEIMITYRDSQALAVLNTAKECGLSVPDDMEIVCILDSKYNTMARPQISGFKIPDYDLGAIAMRLLTKMLKDDEVVVDKEIELSYIFTPRKSTK